MPKEISKVLRSLQNAWKQAEAQQGFTQVPDSDYTAKLKNMEVALSKAGRIQVVSHFEIADGKYEGREVNKFDGIANDVSIPWFKGFCEVIGFECPDDIEDLPAALEAFIEEQEDELYQLTVKTKDGFTNIYVKGAKIQDGEEEEAEEEETEEEEEEEEEKPKKKKKLARR